MIRVKVTDSPCSTEGKDVTIDGMSKGPKVQYFADEREMNLYIYGILGNFGVFEYQT